MKTSIDQDFTDQDMAQIKRFGQALLEAPTDFDEEVEKRLAFHYPKEFSGSTD